MVQNLLVLGALALGIGFTAFVAVLHWRSLGRIFRAYERLFVDQQKLLAFFIRVSKANNAFEYADYAAADRGTIPPQGSEPVPQTEPVPKPASTIQEPPQ